MSNESPRALLDLEVLQVRISARVRARASRAGTAWQPGPPAIARCWPEHDEVKPLTPAVNSAITAHIFRLVLAEEASSYLQG